MPPCTFNLRLLHFTQFHRFHCTLRLYNEVYAFKIAFFEHNCPVRIVIAYGSRDVEASRQLGIDVYFFALCPTLWQMPAQSWSPLRHSGHALRSTDQVVTDKFENLFIMNANLQIIKRRWDVLPTSFHLCSFILLLLEVLRQFYGNPSKTLLLYHSKKFCISL